jgi:Thioredoxin like C-terminal domain
MYQLIRQPKPIEEGRFEIEFVDAGVEALVFTFG